MGLCFLFDKGKKLSPNSVVAVYTAVDNEAEFWEGGDFHTTDYMAIRLISYFLDGPGWTGGKAVAHFREFVVYMGLLFKRGSQLILEESSAIP